MALKRVEFKEALHLSNTFSGIFDVVRGPYQKAGQKRDCMFKIIKDGAVTRVHAYNHDFKIIGDDFDASNDSDFDEMSEENLNVIRAEIRRCFRVLEKLSNGIVNQRIRSCIISGATGIGKTHHLLYCLKEAEKTAKINKFTKISGRVSAIALFALLYDHRDEGDVLMLDDVDVFDEETKLDLCKAALDTTGDRTLKWLVRSDWLEQNGIEDEFEFNGACIFITNKNFDAIVESGSSLAEHVKALMSRSIYLDMCIHTKLEVMLRIEMVVQETNILENEKLNPDQGLLLMDWLWENFRRMREISIRSVGKIGEFIKTDPDEWEEMAEVTQIKRVR